MSDQAPRTLTGHDPNVGKISEEQAEVMLREERERVLRGLGFYDTASRVVGPIAREDVRPPDWSAR